PTMIDDCTEFGRSTRITRVNGTARTLFASGASVGAGVFHLPRLDSTSDFAAASVMSPTNITVVFFGEYIDLCHAITSSSVSFSSDAFVPPLNREYGVSES